MGDLRSLKDDETRIFVHTHGLEIMLGKINKLNQVRDGKGCVHDIVNFFNGQ